MVLYNCTNTILSFSSNNLRIQVQPYSCSKSININPDVIRGSILPLINMYGDKILVVLNSVELGLLSKPGYHLPAENVVDHEIAELRVKREYTANTGKTKDSIKPVEEPKGIVDDLGAGVPVKHENEAQDNFEIPELRRIKSDK